MEASILKGLSEAIGQPSIIRNVHVEETGVVKALEAVPLSDTSSIPVLPANASIPSVPDNITTAEDSNLRIKHGAE